MIQKMSHVCIWVKNQEEARAFYVDTLGFELRTDVEMEGFRWLTVGPKSQPDLELILMEPAAGPTMDEETASALRALIDRGVLGAGVFATSDCQATYDELKAKGVNFRRPPTDQFYGKEAIMTDNSGSWFSLCEPKEHEPGAAAKGC
jgi:catechol 2,3-dioxygenase-like lactoylglutathione lyase family enzyme